MTISEIIDRVLDLTIEIQQIPAPTFHEGERAQFIKDLFHREGLLDTAQDEVGNVIGRLPGKATSQPIIISAHLDTVFPAGTDLSITRQAKKIAGPGIGDNAIGVAGLLGTIWILRELSLEPGSDLWFAANVGEEGLGDLRGMRALVDRYADTPQAYIILEGMALGQVYHRALGVNRYRITVTTSGGHSWVDFGKPSAVHEIAEIINQLTKLEIPEQPRTTLNVGMISGGTSVNTIAAEAHLELDLRSEDQVTLDEMIAKITALVQKAEEPGIEISMELIGQRPPGEIPETHPLVKMAVSGLEAVGIQPRLNIGSTDANIPLSLGYPAIGIGLTTGNGAHTLREFINTPPLQMGLNQLVWIIEGLNKG